MSSDFRELLEVFNKTQVEYLLVGGLAVIEYTEPRYTKDMDLWIRASHENSIRTFSALSEFGAPLQGLTASDFSEEGFFYQMGLPPARVDILMSLPSVSFEEAWPRRGTADLWGVMGPLGNGALRRFRARDRRERKANRDSIGIITSLVIERYSKFLDKSQNPENLSPNRVRH